MPAPARRFDNHSAKALKTKKTDRVEQKKIAGQWGIGNAAAATTEHARMDITALVNAIQALTAEDAFRCALSPAQWQWLAAHMSRREVRAGELLIHQGETRRVIYFLEQGNLQVFVTGGPPGSHRIAVLRPGSLVGEPALFTEVPRMANVEAMTPCVVWSLQGEQLKELAAYDPHATLELLRAAGAVMAVRLRINLMRGLPMA